MYKYLLDKFEDSYGAYIDDICFVTNEIARDSQSEFIEDMCRDLDDKEICKIFGWRSDEEVTEWVSANVKDNEFTQCLIDQHKYGIIARCHFPELSNFSESGNIFQVHKCSCVIEYVYANSYPEIVEIMHNKAQLRKKISFENSKKENQQ